MGDPRFIAWFLDHSNPNRECKQHSKPIQEQVVLLNQENHVAGHLPEKRTHILQLYPQDFDREIGLIDAAHENAK